MIASKQNLTLMDSNLAIREKPKLFSDNFPYMVRYDQELLISIGIDVAEILEVTHY